VIILSKKILDFDHSSKFLTLSLTAEERTRTRRPCLADSGEELYLQLSRGIVLEQNDILTTQNEEVFVKILAKSEKILRVTTHSQLKFLRAIYHLANRHIPLEINLDNLALENDPVLKELLIQMGLDVELQDAPFFPEHGAYHQH
jgi:urease accessory protein